MIGAIPREMNRKANILIEKPAPTLDKAPALVAGDVSLNIQSYYMTTKEAAKYMRKSVSWLVKQADMPYLKGCPNLYKKADLDAWFERHKFIPRLKAA